MAIARLPCLKSLELDWMGLESLPDSVAKALRCLTHLSMDINNFSMLPSSLSLITTLRSLRIQQMPPQAADEIPSLRLSHGDVKTLVALPNLQMLDISFLMGWLEWEWSGDDKDVIDAIKLRLSL